MQTWNRKKYTTYLSTVRKKLAHPPPLGGYTDFPCNNILSLCYIIVGSFLQNYFKLFYFIVICLFFICKFYNVGGRGYTDFSCRWKISIFLYYIPMLNFFSFFYLIYINDIYQDFLKILSLIQYIFYILFIFLIFFSHLFF